MSMYYIFYRQAVLMCMGLCAFVFIVPTTALAADPTITITSPTRVQIITIGDSFPIRASYTNAPRNTQVLISYKLNLTSPGGASGNTAGASWSSVTSVPPDGVTTYTVQTNNAGSFAPGVYTVSASLRECHPSGCNFNPDFPGKVVPVKTYISTTSVFALIKAANTESTSTKHITIQSKQRKAYRIGDKMSVAWANKGVPFGKNVCVDIESILGKTFTFADDAGNGGCFSSVLAKKSNIFVGTLKRRKGYNLAPGTYRLQFQMIDPTYGGVLETAYGNWFKIL